MFTCSSSQVFFLSFFLKRFIHLFEGESCRGGGRQKESPTRLHAEHGAPYRARSHDSEITAWAETETPVLKLLSHPGSLLLRFS